MIRHDERIALCNKLMRDTISPKLPTSEGACLMLFPLGEAKGMMCYMGKGKRSDMRAMLRSLLTKWDNDAKLKGELNG